MDAAFFLLLAASVSVGVVSAVVTTWSLRARLFSLEDRTTILEGVTQREVKIRAAAERWGGKRSKDEEKVIEALQQPQQAQPYQWWNDPRLKKGAHVP
jgi:hypothetical protein